jgi:hypothetical protein
VKLQTKFSLGIIEMGTLLNGATEKVDTIRDAVFANETYRCKEIVGKNGGQIWADSKMGEWVKFSFTLPNGVDRKSS